MRSRLSIEWGAAARVLGLAQKETQLVCPLVQRPDLALLGDDLRDHLAGETPIHDLELVREAVVNACRGNDFVCDLMETA